MSQRLSSYVIRACSKSDKQLSEHFPSDRWPAGSLPAGLCAVFLQAVNLPEGWSVQPPGVSSHLRSCPPKELPPKYGTPHSENNSRRFPLRFSFPPNRTGCCVQTGCYVQAGCYVQTGCCMLCPAGLSAPQRRASKVALPESRASCKLCDL